ncbi:MAG TPA: hypothetical protein VF767_03855 [Bryobacteraceae bacterium]
MSALAGAPMLPGRREPGWIFRRSWDLPLLIFSAVLVPLPMAAAWVFERSGWMTELQAVNAINLAVATLIGGPHLFSTVTFTFLDRHFRLNHRRYVLMALALPAGVVYLGVLHYTLLIGLLFTWASLHVLHQIIYLTDCYRARSSFREGEWSRVVDYGLILSGLYPTGICRILQGQFHVGGVSLPYPEFCSLCWCGRSRPFPRTRAISQ